MYAEANSSQYDKNVNTFNPSGRLFQIEYACQAINIGAIAIGAKTKNGLVFAAEKRLPNKLVVESSIKKIWKVDDHIVLCSSGLTPDAKKLCDAAIQKSLSYTEVYGDKISVIGMARFLSEQISKFADFDDEERSSRVYGCALLVGGYTKDEGFNLYYLNPSGSYISYFAKAIGSGSTTSELDLKNEYDEDMDREAATRMILKSLKAVMEEPISVRNMDFVVIEESGVKMFTETEKQNVIDEYCA